MKPERTKLLIVDDDEQILYAFQAMFRKDGFDTIVARDGEEALDKVGSAHPAVVIMDITMPKLDGLHALQAMRERSSSTPVILVTGYGTMQTAIKAMQLGA